MDYPQLNFSFALAFIFCTTLNFALIIQLNRAKVSPRFLRPALAIQILSLLAGAYIGVLIIRSSPTADLLRLYLGFAIIGILFFLLMAYSSRRRLPASFQKLGLPVLALSLMASFVLIFLLYRSLVPIPAP